MLPVWWVNACSMACAGQQESGDEDLAFAPITWSTPNTQTTTTKHLQHQVFGYSGNTGPRGTQPCWATCNRHAVVTGTRRGTGGVFMALFPMAQM